MEMNSYCKYYSGEAEINQACYEEKKLLIQNAEARCGNLKIQLDWLRTFLSENTYSDTQSEEINDVRNETSKERNNNVCDTSEILSRDGENQSNPNFQLLSPHTLMERCSVKDDDYSDDCVSRDLMTDDGSEKHVSNGIQSSHSSNIIIPVGINEEYELKIIKHGYIPNMMGTQQNSSELLSYRSLKLESTPCIANTEKLNEQIDSRVIINAKKKSKIRDNKISSSYHEKNRILGPTLHSTFHLRECNDMLMNQTDNDTQPKLRGIKECDTIEKSISINKRNGAVEPLVKENAQAHSVSPIKEPKNNEKKQSCPTRIDHKTIMSKNSGYQRNYRDSQSQGPSIISVTTVPASKFKKENQQIFATKIVKKPTTTLMNDEKSNLENARKNIIPSQCWQDRQKVYGGHLRRNILQGPKTESGNFENPNENEYEQNTQIESVPRERYVSSYSLSKHSVAMQHRETRTRISNGSQEILGQHETQSNVNLQPISVYLVQKEPRSSNSTTNKKVKKNFSHGNKESEENKTKFLRNSFGLHTVSSKLKMSEKLQSQRPNSKYPFVVGKATTTSHNLILNIQQTLSIMKMKPPPNQSTLAKCGTIECKEFPLAFSTDGSLRCTAAIDPTMLVQARSSASQIQHCPLLNQDNNLMCIIQSDIAESQDWYLFQEKYGDAFVNKCFCYPRNCTNYNKVIDQYIPSKNDIQFLHENEELQSYGRSKKFHPVAVIHGETTRDRLTQILRQVQSFQYMFNRKYGA